MDNDSDGDMLPDWYEYEKGWNESNDNFSSQRYVEVQWIDPATGVQCTSDTTSCRPLSINGDNLSRPVLGLTWATFDPRDPLDANQDPDQDGNWDCEEPLVSILLIPISWNSLQLLILIWIPQIQLDF